MEHPAGEYLHLQVFFPGAYLWSHSQNDTLHTPGHLHIKLAVSMKPSMTDQEPTALLQGASKDPIQCSHVWLLTKVSSSCEGGNSPAQGCPRKEVMPDLRRAQKHMQRAGRSPFQGPWPLRNYQKLVPMKVYHSGLSPREAGGQQ